MSYLHTGQRPCCVNRQTLKNEAYLVETIYKWLPSFNTSSPKVRAKFTSSKRTSTSPGTLPFRLEPLDLERRSGGGEGPGGGPCRRRPWRRVRSEIQVTGTRGQRPARSGAAHTFTFTAGRRRRRRAKVRATRVRSERPGLTLL